MGLREERELEWLCAEAERQQGIIDYVAMMADVELPTDDDQEVGGDE